MLQDSLRSIRNYYYRAPQFAKNIIGGSYRQLPEALTLGRSHKDFVHLLKEGEGWSSQQVLDYQFEQMRATLNIAHRHTEFYRKKFEEHGVTPADFRAPDDIIKFPTTTKSEVKKYVQQFINLAIPKWRMLPATTGGSTAEPMRFYQLKGVTRSKEKAFIASGWSRVGYKHGRRAVQLKGRPVGLPDKKIFWEYEPIQNILEMDSSYLTLDNIPLYCAAIHKFKPEFIIGFPSSLYLFAKYLRQAGIEPPRVRAVMLASENVYPWQRELLTKTFDCRIFSHYGHSEMVLLGMEAPASQDLLFFPQYGYLEVVDSQGLRVHKEGQKGQLVGTSFHNPVMPFIRYETQDVGILGAPDRDLPFYPALREVEGRLQEFIITADGRGISVCTMGAAHFDNLDNVLETQYYQERAGELEFRVVPTKDFSERDHKQILQALQDKVGRHVDVRVVTVTEIQRTASGKHMMLLQKIPNAELNFDMAE